jgi:hypothetical protein
MGRLRGVPGPVTDTVVISGAVAVPTGDATATPLLSVPELVDVAIADPGQGAQLVLENRTGASQTAAVEGGAETIIASGGSVAVGLCAAPGGARLHLQILSREPPHVVTLIVTVEPSDDGPVAVAQAIGAHAQ